MTEGCAWLWAALRCLTPCRRADAADPTAAGGSLAGRGGEGGSGGGGARIADYQGGVGSVANANHAIERDIRVLAAQLAGTVLGERRAAEARAAEAEEEQREGPLTRDRVLHEFFDPSAPADAQPLPAPRTKAELVTSSRAPASDARLADSPCAAGRVHARVRRDASVSQQGRAAARGVGVWRRELLAVFPRGRELCGAVCECGARRNRRRPGHRRAARGALVPRPHRPGHARAAAAARESALAGAARLARRRRGGRVGVADPCGQLPVLPFQAFAGRRGGRPRRRARLRRAQVHYWQVGRRRSSRRLARSHPRTALAQIHARGGRAAPSGCAGHPVQRERAVGAVARRGALPGGGRRAREQGAGHARGRRHAALQPRAHRAPQGTRRASAAVSQPAPRPEPRPASARASLPRRSDGASTC